MAKKTPVRNTFKAVPFNTQRIPNNAEPRVAIRPLGAVLLSLLIVLEQTGTLVSTSRLDAKRILEAMLKPAIKSLTTNAD